MHRSACLDRSRAIAMGAGGLANFCPLPFFQKARKLQDEVRKLRLGPTWARSHQFTALAGQLPLQPPASWPWNILFNMK